MGMKIGQARRTDFPATIRIGVILRCAKREEEDTAQSGLTKRWWGNVPGTQERRERLDLRIPRETGGNECLEGRRHFELSLHHRQNQIAVVTRENYQADRCHVVLAVQFRKVSVILRSFWTICSGLEILRNFKYSSASEDQCDFKENTD